MMYQHVRQYAGNLDVDRACAALNVSKSGYFDWQKRSPAAPDPFEMKLRSGMQQIALSFPCYGYRRMSKELRRRGFMVNHKRILALMRKDNLLCVRKRFKPQTTDSNHSFRVYPNLARDLQVTGLNQLWVADITYIRLLREFVYLAVIIDVFSRRCIGWELSRNIDTKLTLNALTMAMRKRRGMKLSGLVHHSDQGVQYAADEYVAMLGENGIRISMSRKGNPYDNAFAESFMKTLKAEEVDLSEYESFIEAYENIERFIEVVYNKKRLHSSIGYAPPVEFERGVALKRRAS